MNRLPGLAGGSEPATGDRVGENAEGTAMEQKPTRKWMAAMAATGLTLAGVAGCGAGSGNGGAAAQPARCRRTRGLPARVPAPERRVREVRRPNRERIRR